MFGGWWVCWGLIVVSFWACFHLGSFVDEIKLRVVFRLIEFDWGAGHPNPILAHDRYQLGLDAFPTVIVLAVLNALHPGLVLKGEWSSYSKTKWRRHVVSVSNFVAILSLSGDEVNPVRVGG